MKLLAYHVRPDELAYFKKLVSKYGIDLVMKKENPTVETAEEAKGCTCISTSATPMDAKLLQKFYDVGIRFVSTRSIGYDNIDIDAAKKIGMHVGNVSYSPSSVADYTVMMILMATRKMKAIALNNASQNFALGGVQGIELHNLTVGILGTGRIGRLVAKRLSSFDCRIIAYDLYENEGFKSLGEYVPLKRLFAESDLITMHMPATKDNYHLINKDTLALMKDGVFLINTARGSLIDTPAFFDAVESGKIGGAALDVIENEAGMIYNDLRYKVLKNRERAVLMSYPNVIVTPHTAFYTDQAVSDMVEHSIQSCLLFTQGKKDPWQVV